VSTIYLETSALLKWLLGQPGAEQVRQAVNKAKVVATSDLTFAEAERVLTRHQNAGDLREGDARKLRGLLNKTGLTWTKMAISANVLDRAKRVFPVEPVRTLDAIHLATALEFAAVLPNIVVLSDDRRIMDNAEALGIA
jgi:predicted nucleic acid-binding protein